MDIPDEPAPPGQGDPLQEAEAAEAEYRQYVWPYESEENLLAFMTPHLKGTEPVEFWLIPHKGIGPGPTLDYAARRHLASMTTKGTIVARFISLSPHERWEISLPAPGGAPPASVESVSVPVEQEPAPTEGTDPSTGAPEEAAAEGTTVTTDLSASIPVEVPQPAQEEEPPSPPSSAEPEG